MVGHLRQGADDFGLTGLPRLPSPGPTTRIRSSATERAHRGPDLLDPRPQKVVRSGQTEADEETTDASREMQPLPRVALAACTRGCPGPRLREWLFWHLSKGVCLMLLRWEGPMDKEQRAALSGPLARGEVILLTQAFKGQASGSFQRVMTRQIKFVHQALEVAQQHGCHFLLHLDDDELLFPKEPGQTIPELLRRHIGTTKRCIHFENLEAVFSFEVDSSRPFSRPSTRFRTQHHVLYCNGKSAANLTAPGQVFASGVHHFCRHDRSFVEACESYGLHDEGAGCTHSDCCIQEWEAVVLHFDSPSLTEWHAKFRTRAAASLNALDKEEMLLFPFKQESIDALRKASSKRAAQEQQRVYRHWRCLPGRGEPQEVFDDRLCGQHVEAEFASMLLEARALQALERTRSECEAVNSNTRNE
ncbi:unnamed protein product [Polarella glacialis]|uniref:Glycosyltransferase family 92 protein n=1 Tax=Polarella glacialis TaxID=89957 RepID=A0A813FVF6_POLGL|nr:unnamed protein product [Polarella glacialis]